MYVKWDPFFARTLVIVIFLSYILGNLCSNLDMLGMSQAAAAAAAAAASMHTTLNEYSASSSYS